MQIRRYIISSFEVFTNTQDASQGMRQDGMKGWLQSKSKTVLRSFAVICKFCIDEMIVQPKTAGTKPDRVTADMGDILPQQQEGIHE